MIRLNFHTDGDIHLVEEGKGTAKSGAGKIASQQWQSCLLRMHGGKVSLDVEGKPVLGCTVTRTNRGDLSLVSSAKGTTVAFKDLWLRELGPDGKPLGAAQPDSKEQKP